MLNIKTIVSKWVENNLEVFVALSRGYKANITEVEEAVLDIVPNSLDLRDVSVNPFRVVVGSTTLGEAVLELTDDTCFTVTYFPHKVSPLKNYVVTISVDISATDPLIAAEMAQENFSELLESSAVIFTVEEPEEQENFIVTTNHRGDYIITD